MKKSLQVVTILVALGLVFSSVLIGLAQQKRPILGGYQETDKDSPEVQEAAEFAVGEQGRKQDATIKLVSVERAERQVVAGMNYRLCMKVEITAEGEDEATTQEVKVVVYRNLQKEYSLTSWEEAECGGNESEQHHAH